MTYGPGPAQLTPGPEGLGLTWRGDYDDEAQYILNDLVSYDGSVYIALQSSVDVEPGSDADYRDVFSMPGEAGQGIVWEGTYDGDVTYQKYDAVRYGKDSFVYTNNTPASGNAPTPG